VPADEPDKVLLPSIDTELAAAIAYAISAWARFEYEIDEFIWALARLEPEQGACLTAQLQTVAARFNALLSLARVEQVKPRHIRRLNTIRERSNGLAEKRNRLVHDPWFYGYQTKENYRLEKTARAKLIHRYEHVTEEEIKASKWRSKTYLLTFATCATRF
jgi:hypothetical protein